MTTYTKELGFSTQGDDDLIEITPDVESAVKKAGLKNGQATVFVIGSTAAITTIEYESGLKHDIKELLDELIPKKRNWRHNSTWGDGNGHAHLRASIIGPSLTMPVVSGSLTLGTWQQIVYIDFDNRPRSRKVVVQIVGD